MPSLEELLKAALSNKPSTLEVADIDDAEKFFRAMRIKPGKHKVSSKALHKAYSAWSVKPQGYQEFAKTAQAFFPRAADSTHRLNYHPIQLLNKVDNLKVK